MMRFELVQGDITDVSADAIVNAADAQLTMGGGVAGAIKAAGGDELRRAARDHAPLKVGAVAVTRGYNLDVMYVIHAATMEVDGRADLSVIRQGTRAALEAADERGCTDIVFPALGCGRGGVELTRGALAIVTEIRTRRSESLRVGKLILRTQEDVDTVAATLAG